MKADGSGVRRLTNRPGARRRAVLLVGRHADRVSRPPRSTPGAEMDDYRALLKKALWRPTELELFVMDRDGRNLTQVTKLGGRQLRAVVASRRQAPDLRVEHRRPERAQLRHLPASTSTAPASSASPSTTPSTGSRCSRRTASISCSRPTATRRPKGRPTSSSRTGSSRRNHVRRATCGRADVPRADVLTCSGGCTSRRPAQKSTPAGDTG